MYLNKLRSLTCRNVQDAGIATVGLLYVFEDTLYLSTTIQSLTIWMIDPGLVPGSSMRLQP